MRPQTLAVVLLALVSGLAAVWGVRSLTNRPKVVEEKVKVVVALEDLAQDEPIDAKRVEVREMPISQAPEGRLATPEDAAERIPAIPMLKGEPVIEAKLIPKGSKPEAFPVVFALEDLPAGLPIDARRVEVREVPKSRAPMGFLAAVDDVVSRSPSEPIAKGGAVVESKLFPKDVRPDLSLLVEPGKRAWTIQVPGFSPTIAGLFRRGNRVDVLYATGTRNSEPAGGLLGAGGPAPAATEKEDLVTSTLIQNVELLEVHENPRPNGALDGTSAVTLLVAPREAAILALAQSQANGTLLISLRNQDDRDRAADATAILADLSPEPDAAPIPMTIRTLRGTKLGADVITAPRRRRAVSPGR